MSKQNSLVTLDEAVARAKAAGFDNMNKRWWQRNIERGLLEAVDGAVTYVRSEDVNTMIETAKQAQGGRA